MIPFNMPAYAGNEKKYIARAIKSGILSGNGSFGRACEQWFRQRTGRDAFLTPSGTAALEMSAILAGIRAGDEVIMPSYTYPSAANAFVLRGARIIFTDIRPDTMNMDENLVDEAVTSKTKVLMVMHYAGIGCEMDTMKAVAEKNSLLLIEDAALSIMAVYKNTLLGTMGDMGCLSFHETKNISCGEGGAILINNKSFMDRAEIVREKGTNRMDFFRGKTSNYSWQDIGSSFMMSELNAAYLYAQLEKAQEITNKRRILWETYHKSFKELEQKEYLTLPFVPEYCTHNGHLYYIKFADRHKRDQCIAFLREKGIMAIFHYIPLHSSRAGKLYGCFHGNDKYTTSESEKLLRLPLYYQMSSKQLHKTVSHIYGFFGLKYNKAV